MGGYMDEILNDGIKVLYVIARQNEDAGTYDDQRKQSDNLNG
jgi:hypothetical protein